MHLKQMRTDALTAFLMGAGDLHGEMGQGGRVGDGSGKGGGEKAGRRRRLEREPVKYSLWPPVCSAASMIANH